MLFRILRITLLLALIAALVVPCTAGVRLGTATVGFGYFNGWGPYCCYYPYYPYSPWYDAFYGPYWSPFGPYYPAGYFEPGPTKGTIKLLHADQNAAVYIDNAYAGKVSELKSINIQPGAYDLELKAPDGKSVQKRIYVLSGKTVRLEF